MKLGHVIKFVADMNRAVKFYRDVLGLPLKFESPGWSEFVTGEWFAKTLADFEINDIAALPPLFCYNS